MANYSLAELTNRMQGKSITLGWDAIVFMNRAKVNSLLEQQYITRFNTDSFLKQITGAPAMTPDGEEYIELNGLILSHPRLSFEKASLRNSQVTATMDIVSGTVSYVRKGTNQLPGAVLYSYVVSAHQGHTVTMDIDLSASQGTVSEQGQVIVDFGDAYNCRCSLVNEDKSQELLGDFFKALFLEQKPEDRVYTLGMLDLRDVDLLAPRSFMIRTMATDEGKIRTSDDYGEGAVVLLVRTKGNTQDGADPADGALDYLIPNDRDAQGKTKYSGSLVLASRVVFDWYIQDPIQKIIGNGLRFKRNSESNGVARSLSAIAGEFRLPGYLFRWFNPNNRDSGEAASVGEHKLSFYSVNEDSSLRIYPTKGSELAVKWDMSYLLPFEVHIDNIIDEHYYSNAEVDTGLDILLRPVVDPSSGKTVFESKFAEADFNSNYQPVVDSYRSIQFHQNFYPYTYGIQSTLNGHKNFFLDRFKRFDIPEINTLAISNLLFPERNALQLSEARLPGDLALFGQIDPKETSFTLDPLLPVIKAGQKQVFTIRQLGYRAADVTWSVRGVDGARATGTIDNGEFTAPQAQLLEGTAARNIVTATYTDPVTGKEVTASAMVTVALSGVVVTPSMLLIDMSDKRSSKLRATTLGAGPLKWTQRGGPGTLVPNGDEAIYTPPTTNLPDGTLEPVLIDVEDTSTGEKSTVTVLLRQGNFALNITPALHPGLRPEGTTLLKVPENILPNQLKWEVVAGQGQVDPTTGVFTAPTNITVPYAVVKATLEEEHFDVLGYSIIHLSEHARQSNWYSLDIFDFVVGAEPPTVYANGLQQARVVVRVKPSDVDGKPVELSDSEIKSICLVSADEKNPLPEVGGEGVPAGDKWYYTETENHYQKYPRTILQSDDTENAPANLVTKEFFVQCHKVEDLRVSARLRSDSFQTFYSNPKPSDGEPDRKVINLVAVQPPAGGTEGSVAFTFGLPDNYPDRVEGDKNDDNDLSTLDYYYLKLIIKSEQIKILDIKFQGNTSMVKWESNTQLEDVHSITGYAKYGDMDPEGNTILHIDDILYRRMGGALPAKTVSREHPVPEGTVLFSLERREYWRYDQYAKTDFEVALKAIVFDVYGNQHPVVIGFDGVNRNKLKIIG